VYLQSYQAAGGEPPAVRRGRAARQSERLARTMDTLPYLTRKLPPVEVISTEGLEQIEANADTLLERVGLAVFGELGTVAPSLGDLPQAKVHASYGVGLRISLERLAVFRTDIGFSDEGTNLTIAFGLSF
jgi:hypothetical protein